MRAPLRSPGSAVMVRRGSAIGIPGWQGQYQPGPSEASGAGSRFARRRNQTLDQAIERHRALGGDEARKIMRRAPDHARHLGVIIALDQRGEPVDVSGNDVSAELVADLERPLEIDARAMAPAADRGDAQCFRRGIDREPGAAILLTNADHCHAHARAGDRGTFDNRGALVAAGDLQPMQPFAARGMRLAVCWPAGSEWSYSPLMTSVGTVMVANRSVVSV